MKCSIEVARNQKESTPCCEIPPLLSCECEEKLDREYSINSGYVDTYTCIKKNSCYFLRYASGYASEIYHYLNKSEEINSKNHFTSSDINIYSLGCGAAIDYYAFEKYFSERKNRINFRYFGYDNSTSWDKLRPNGKKNIRFETIDLSKGPITLEKPSIVIIGKLYSTLFRQNNGSANLFLINLKGAIKKYFLKDTILVFVDINNSDFGRDQFDRVFSNRFNRAHRYYYQPNKDKPYTKPEWEKIENLKDVFNDSQTNPDAHPLKKTIIFEYTSKKI